MKNNREKIDFNYNTHEYYRGVGVFVIKEKFQIPIDAIEEIQKYDYFTDFPIYYELIKTL